MKFEFFGMDELLNEIERAGIGMGRVEEKGLKAGAEVMQKEAIKAARVKTGNLIKHVEISEVQGGEIEVYVDQQGKAYYGVMLETGTSRMSAKPWMGPAYNRSTFNIQRAIAAEIRKELRWS